MASRVDIVIPTVDKIGTPLLPLEVDTALRRVKDAFCDWFGGCTVYTGHGCWKLSDGSIMSEPVTIVYAYSVPGNFIARSVKRQRVIDLAAGLAGSLRQECVLVHFELEAPCFVVPE
jgi:hypothetical protein